MKRARNILPITLLAGLLCVSLCATSAFGAQVRITEIVGVGSFVPDSRLGLGASIVGDPAMTHLVNAADCAAYQAHDSPTIQLTWSWTDKPSTVSEPVFSVKVAPVGKTCNSNSLDEVADSGCKVVAKGTKFTDQSGTLNQKTKLSMADLLAGVDCKKSVDGLARIYFVLGDNDPQSAFGQATGLTMNVDLDLVLPAAPTIESLVARDQALDVSFHLGGDAEDKARVYWSETESVVASGSTAAFKSALLSDKTYTIGSLTNGVTYYVIVVAVDRADNQSAPSAVSSQAPAAVQDLWRYYKSQGGRAEGGDYGCQASRWSPSGQGACAGLLLGLLALLVWRRRFGRA